MNHYGISKKTDLTFDEAVEKVTALLLQEGFGVISKIDIQKKMKEKLGKEMAKYLVLGTCHPLSAYEAIQKETEIGLLLPCNVIIYEKRDKIFVSAIRPKVTMNFVNNPNIEQIAKNIEKSLEKVVLQV